MNNLGVFNLTEDDLNTQIINADGSTQSLGISDGVVEILELFHNEGSWGLSVYEAENYYAFCKNENLLIFHNACLLFDEEWNKE